MRFKVVTVRDRGRRLSRAEIEAAEPIVGEMLIRDLAANQTSGRRAQRYADLLDLSNPNTPRSLRKPLFDPVIVRMTEHSMLLMGHEVNSAEGVIHEHVQGWLLRPV